MNIILSTHPLLKCINIRIHTTKTVYSGTPLFLLCSTLCVKTWGRYSMKQTIPQETGSEISCWEAHTGWARDFAALLLASCVAVIF